ncbi:hypothetical protein KA005_02140 [bacterium]|nr:hypothetical protein [bacterium]
MAEPDRTGTFRCVPVDTGVGQTKNNFPQFLAQVKLLEYYDEENKVWVPWEEYEQEISLYAILFGYGKKSGKFEPTLNHVQVSKVFGWDGTDFNYLAETDFSDLKFQVRVDENTYGGATSNYQVGWIDEYDAEPGRKIRKLDAKEVKDLNKQFAMLLKQTGKKAAPAKAPAKAPEINESKPDLPIPKKSGKKKQTEAVKAKAPPKAPPKPPTMPGLPEGKCTKQEAWETVCDLKDSDCDDKQLNATWQAVVEATAPGINDTDITPEQWFIIRDAVLDDVGKF